MTLPAKNEKGYLKVTDLRDGFAIVAHPDHAAELEALFAQHELPCRRTKSISSGEDTLVFDKGADRAKVEETLRAYEQAKGS